MMGATPESEFVYLAGAAMGLSYANTALILEGRTPLFCPPGSYVLGVDEMKHLTHAKLKGPHKPDTFVIAALTELQKRYPCKR